MCVCVFGGGGGGGGVVRGGGGGGEEGHIDHECKVMFTI